jgi:cytochrome P450
MAPIFTPGAIAKYVEVVTQVVARAVDSWKPGETVDLGREMTRITMAVVGKALFDSDAFDEADELGEALTVALQWVNDSFDSRWLGAQLALYSLLEEAEGHHLGPRFESARRSLMHTLRAPVFIPSSRGPRLRRAIACLDDKIRRMIEERRAAGGAKDDVLTRLLRARDEDGSKMSDRQVRDEAVSLFTGGHETTATTLTWAFYRLSRDPALLARLTAEADAITDEEGFRDPSKLTLSIAIFKEAMRLYPSLYLLSRRSLEPVTLGGFDLPKGTLVLMSPYCVHRRPEVYSDPERFDPDRFTPAAEAARPRSAYLPFGAGPRVCVGGHFAMMQGPIVLAALARRLSFSIPPGPLVKPGPFATLRPGEPISATVVPRAPRQGAPGRSSRGATVGQSAILG